MKPGNQELVLGLHWRMGCRSVSKYKSVLYLVSKSNKSVHDFGFASGGGFAREWRSNLKPATIEKGR
ncbi:MAG: hypothetical protein ACKVE4_10140 [Dissulfuribacterales bacterium]